MERKNIELDEKNNEFWNELCGTHLASVLGIEGDSAADLKRFDDWYLDYYQYLSGFLPQHVKGKDLLEIGLGYGTISSMFMAAGANYTGIDISNGPVNMSLHRAQLLGVKNNAMVASALNLPFEDNSFDHVVSIGCLHHTGDLTKGLAEVMRVLKKGGSAHVMVYNLLSYRQLIDTPLRTLVNFLRPASTLKFQNVFDERYDANSDGVAAPETVYVKKSQLRAMFGKQNITRIYATNIGSDGPFKKMDRNVALKYFGPFLGLDLYAISEKQ